MDNLDEFLKGDSEAAPEVEAIADTPETEVAQPEVETPPAETEAKAEGQPRGPDGKFIPKGETQPETVVAPPATEEASSTIPEAALIGERRRRQEAEARIAEYEARLAQLQQAQQQPQAPPDRWEDPEGYDRWLTAQITAAAERRAIEAFNYQRIATAATQFRAEKPDYDETINVFGQMANVNPTLIAQMQQAANPAEFAYNTAKQAIAIQNAGSLEAYIQQEAARLAAEKQPAPEPTPAPPIPETLADAQSSRGSSAGSFAPKPLEEILGKAFRQS